MFEDLSDLVDNPRETLEIELKQWMNLEDRVNRAAVARHLAALCNHGGGYLVFGVRDDLTPDPARPSSLDQFSRDTFSAIVRRFLSPPFQCDVDLVTGNSGETFPVVRVPAHGSVPVCALRSGPDDDQGRSQGIREGTYYYRTPGPESAPIRSVQDWSDLIRRCTRNDREALLGDIAMIMQPPRADQTPAKDRLLTWHESVQARYGEALSNAEPFHWPEQLATNHYQLSYLISHSDPPFGIGDLRRVLEEINNEVRDTVWTGWSMFYPFTPRDIAPAVFPENSDGTGGDLLEANLLREGDFSTSVPDFWRAAPDGRVSLVRLYREDVRINKPGRWLSPETVVRETAELVRHARAFAQRFPTASTVSFRCTWKGLHDRELTDFDPGIYWSPGRRATASERILAGEWPVVQLGAAWPKIVAELGCPILHLFGFTDCSPEFVEGMKHRFIKL